ncbi:NAD dependent epimerase/dehydratase family protein (plasmid) [Mesorhizobium loti]|nr:NAD dependent epimerase/dehydratase family protein [Mesorhizobium loti]
MFILRPPYLYGPQNDSDRETFIWSRALSGGPVIVPGTGSALIALIQFLHVEDLAALFIYLLKSVPDISQIYNVAAPEIMTSYEWARRLAAIAGRDIELLRGAEVAPKERPRDYFPFRDTNCIVNPQKLFATTDGRPQFDWQKRFTATFESHATSDLIVASPTTAVETFALEGRMSG